MQLVTIKDVSQFLSVKEPTLYSWAYNGTIPCYKLNGILRFDLEEIKKWVKSSKIVPEISDLSATPGKPQDIDALVKNTTESRERSIIIPAGNQTVIKALERRVKLWAFTKENRSGG